MKEEKIKITVNQEDVQNIIDYYEKDIKLIEKLKKENTKLWEQKLEYIDRISKAIEYINNNQLFDFEYDDEELFEYITDLKVKETLRKILKGEKE